MGVIISYTPKDAVEIFYPISDRTASGVLNFTTPSDGVINSYTTSGCTRKGVFIIDTPSQRQGVRKFLPPSQGLIKLITPWKPSAYEGLNKLFTPLAKGVDLIYTPGDGVLILNALGTTAADGVRISYPIPPDLGDGVFISYTIGEGKTFPAIEEKGRVA